jgi:protein-S-isoprenylcysteine O-methyltransferase Ste14
MSQSRLRLNLTRVFAVLVIFVFVLGSSEWSVKNPFVEETLFFVGMAFVGFGAAGRAWATAFISGHKSERMITTGPYSMCRNPLYLFSWMIGVGIGFCTETFTAPLILGSGLLVLNYFQIKAEEKHLSNTFGDEYQAYLMNAPRFFPSFRNYSEPEEIRVSPRIMRKGFFGIAFLILLVGAMEALEYLHQSGIFPVLFRVY